jgi:hypothetical protein
MFDYVSKPLAGPHWIMGFMVQQLGIPAVVMVFALLALSPIEPVGGKPGLTGILAVAYLYPSLVGFPLASVALRLWRQSSGSGQWIWVLPLMAWGHDLFFVELDSPFATRLANQFTMSGSSSGGELYVVTIPTLACIWYSLRMFLRSREGSRDIHDGANGGTRDRLGEIGVRRTLGTISGFGIIRHSRGITLAGARTAPLSRPAQPC